MARKREFDEEEVLEALCDVFWEHGYDGTSYSQIMAATGLQKGSLYAAFGDKKALYLKAIGRYDQQAVTCLLYTSPSPRDKRQSRMPSSA